MFRRLPVRRPAFRVAGGSCAGTTRFFAAKALLCWRPVSRGTRAPCLWPPCAFQLRRASCTVASS